jgi:chromosome segregation protein
MKLKQIQLQGFKSFVERTVLSFTDDITCVVGPNGCGKSNVLDAIRWCMGEQSVKQLRGDSMEDVIFHGSDDLAAVGMAEVTMVFDNSEGAAPPEYANFTDIQVSRRLFRSGESEYYLNRAPCRLKDITDLFLGSGAGTRAYSIVEQGKIENIITMKPEQRRGLIEEAAGVSKYRARRQEAQRKMEATRQNLLRIRDIIAEIKRQLNSLNRQAKKAERYKEYREELRGVELELAAVRAAGLVREREEGKARLRDLESREFELVARLQSAEAELELERAGMLERERELSSGQARWMEATRALEREEQNLLLCRHQEETHGRDQARLAREREEMEVRDRALAEEIAAIAAEGSGLREAIAEAEESLRGAEAARRAKEEAYRALVQTAEGLEMESRSVVSGAEKLKEWLRWGERRRAELEERKQRLGLRAQELESSLESQARTNLGYNERLYQLRKDHADHRSQLGAREQEIGEARSGRAVAADRLQTARESLATASTRLASLKEMERNLEGYQSGVKAVMARKARLESEGLNGTYGLMAEAVSAEPEYELAVEAVLGERMQSVFVKTRRHGLDNIRYLREESGGRSNFIPLEGMASAEVSVPEELRSLGAVPLVERVRIREEYSPSVRALIGDALVVDDLERAAEVRQALGVAHPLVTREGALLDRVGLLAGGSQDSFGGLLAKKREVSELSVRVEELIAEEEKARAELTAADQLLAALSAEGERLKERSYRLEIEKNNLEKDLRQGTDAYNNLQRQQQGLEEEAGGIEESLQSLLAEAEEAGANIAGHEQNKQRLDAELWDRKQALDLLRAEREAERQRCTAAQVTAAGLREKCAAQSNQLGRLERGREEIRAGLRRRAAELEEIGGQARTVAREMAAVLAARDRAVLAAKALEEKVAAERARFEAETAGLREREGRIQGLYRDREALKGERMDAELLLSQLQVQWEGLAENCRDKFSREPEDVLAEYGGLVRAEGYALEARKGLREELRQKLERMGDVNLTAIEEYEELNQRHTFLTNQEADLIQALDNLEVAIAKINTAYKRAFKVTFEEVNLKIQEVFPRLFPGGKAYLQLTNPEDILESGVEIMTQLPGKKVASIVLLSGGEKALVASALIFALFLVKPSPFCILDEVDAALDEANVGRFSEIVKDLAQNSQLIIITHNKRTMDLAHALYGVTMERKGVSKIVSVRLRDPEEPHGVARDT